MEVETDKCVIWGMGVKSSEENARYYIEAKYGFIMGNWRLRARFSHNALYGNNTREHVLIFLIIMIMCGCRIIKN